MRLISLCGVASLFMATHFVTPLLGQDTDPNTKKVLMLVNNKTSPINFDPALKLRLEWQHGAEVVLDQPELYDTAGLDTLAREFDLVLISESLGSTSVLEDGTFKLNDTPVPVISFEAYMWDDAFWTELPQFATFGNTGRTDLIEGPEAEGLELPQRDIYITAVGAQHPMGAGNDVGPVTIHTIDYSVNFATPSASATVIATADAAGNWPTHFVYETGSSLVDGSVVPAPRIGFFLGQAANPTANFAPAEEYYTEQGFALMDAMFEYTLGPMPTPGDVNQDGKIDLADFAVIRDQFLTVATTPEEMTRADVNHDWNVDFADFGLWKLNSQAPAGAVVPEPEWPSLGLGCLGLLLLRGRRV